MGTDYYVGISAAATTIIPNNSYDQTIHTNYFNFITLGELMQYT